MADRHVENWSVVPGLTPTGSEYKLMLKNKKLRETGKQKVPGKKTDEKGKCFCSKNS